MPIFTTSAPRLFVSSSVASRVLPVSTRASSWMIETWSFRANAYVGRAARTARDVMSVVGRCRRMNFGLQLVSRPRVAVFAAHGDAVPQSVQATLGGTHGDRDIHIADRSRCDPQVGR